MTRDNLLLCISIEPNICFGKPCIRGHRIWVSLILDYLESGMTINDILEEYPSIERDDILACIAYKQRLDFLLQVLLETSRNDGNPQIIYPILQTNLDKLDIDFAKILRFWANNILTKVELTKAQSIAAAIGNFSSLIGQFPQGNQTSNFEIAIAGCEVITSVFTHNTLPKYWAIAKLNLGNAYTNRIKGDRKENLEQAIIAYYAALEVFNRNAFPQDWATIQQNLGIVYHRLQRLKEAIAAYQAALEVFTREAFPQNWAITQTNLATTYCDWIGTDRAENLELAITAYKAALQVFTQQAFPYFWAMTQNNLGTTYNQRIHGEPKENLALAIMAYKNALQVHTHDAFPYAYATVQNNLGNAYRELGELALAEVCYKAALEIHTPTALPVECFRAGQNLGKMAYDNRLWQEAIEGYTHAIEAVETTRTWTPSETRRQEILADAIDIYHNMVQACINAGQIEKALEYAERSRSKRLVDLMASNDLYQGDELTPEVKELLQQYEALQEQIYQERSHNHSDSNLELMGVGSRTTDRAVWQAYNETVASLEAEKQQIWEQLRRLDPVLAGEIQVSPLNFPQIQKLINQPTTAILSFYTTNTDTHIFILRQNQINLHTCSGQGLDTLPNWIEQNWLLPYISDRSTWESQINIILGELSQRLQLSKLIFQHLQGIEELILIPHLLLHQIPFAALPISPPLAGEGLGERFLGDKFLIRHTPSCQILEFCHQRLNVETFHKTSLKYGTVEDAEDNLPCASFEGEQIANLYNIPPEKRLIGRTQATRNNYRQLVQQVHVLHSCHHAQSRLDNPLESELKLGDGSITLGQLMSPGWRLPNLLDVFLSCCETNLGNPSLNDDILTLSTGFLCAGARSVVSTLWVVDDLATALFSIFYYQQRQGGKKRPEVLHQAQIQLRELRKEDLSEISQQWEAKEKELIKQRKQHKKGSPEYLNWESEYNKCAGVNRRINAVKNYPEELPFSHPRYWAAFTSQGLG